MFSLAQAHFAEFYNFRNSYSRIVLVLSYAVSSESTKLITKSNNLSIVSTFHLKTISLQLNFRPGILTNYNTVFLLWTKDLTQIRLYLRSVCAIYYTLTVCKCLIYSTMFCVMGIFAFWYKSYFFPLLTMPFLKIRKRIRNVSHRYEYCPHR